MNLLRFFIMIFYGSSLRSKVRTSSWMSEETVEAAVCSFHVPHMSHCTHQTRKQSADVILLLASHPWVALWPLTLSVRDSFHEHVDQKTKIPQNQKSYTSVLKISHSSFKFKAKRGTSSMSNVFELDRWTYITALTLSFHHMSTFPWAVLFSVCR